MNDHLTKLLSKNGVDKTSNLSFKQLQTIFLMAIRDFKKGDLKLEELCLLASEIVHMPLDNDSEQVAELKETIHLCSEIGYYLRQIPEIDKEGKTTIDFILLTMNYYKNNCSKIGEN